MPAYLSLLSPFRYSFDYYSLHVLQSKDTTVITMQLFTKIVNTQAIPLTLSILKKSLPSILQSQCFNDKKLPFSEELQETEVGHLFEHILLEYLCISKLSHGYKRASYSGVTNWNWRKDPWGTFHITIYTGIKDVTILPKALGKSIDLTNSILQTVPHDNTSSHEPAYTYSPLPLISLSQNV